jgi:competence protein ComEC
VHTVPVAPLPWQRCLLAGVCGLFAGEHAASAGLACALLLLAFGRDRRLASCMLASFCLGAVLGLPPALVEEGGRDGEVRLRGVVREVRTYPGRRVTVEAAEVCDADTGAPLPGGLAWTWVDPPLVPEAGRGFEARLRVRELRGRHNFGLSSGEGYWLHKGVRHRAYSRGRADVLWDDDRPSARGRILAAVSGLVPEGQGGAVVRALLFGDRFDLDPAFMDRIRRAGLSHSLALSGMHLAFVASFGLALAGAVARVHPRLLLVCPRQKMALLMGLPLVLGYMWLGGFTPSLLRAALMLAALALCMLRGERSLPQDTLCLAVAALLLPDPGAARDVGLQLSVLAVTGLVLFMPHFSRLLEGLRRGGRLRRWGHAALTMAAVTVSANLFILPVQALYFFETPVHLWLNFLWLPVLGLAVLPLSFLGLAAMAVSDAAAGACFFLAGLGVDGLDRGLAALDGAGLLRAEAVLRPEGLQVIGYWTVLAACSALQGMVKPSPKSMAFLGLGLLLMAGPSVREGLGVGGGGVELTVLDTGMSQAVSIRGPSGRTLLVDGAGGWSSDYDPGRVLVAPALAWGRPPRLDAVVLTHLDSDHSRGLSYLLEAFDVGCFIWSGLTDDSEDWRSLERLIARGLWPVRVVRAGDRIEIEPGLWLDVLHPPVDEGGRSSNETSVVLRLVWQGRGLAVLPGDAERRALDGVLRPVACLSADVLVLPHHGSRSSLRPELYRRVGAVWAVAACGPGNRFGFPHPEVVRACEAAGSAVLTTADHGAVRFRWAGAGPPQADCARPATEAGPIALCPGRLSCMPPLERHKPRSGP